MGQLLEALKANWEGYEKMRKDFLKAPKWGNDDDYADDIAKWVFEKSVEIFKENKMVGWEGGISLISQSVATYVLYSAVIGAQAFGRRHGEVLHDGGVSPYMGMDKKGPTAVLNSVAKLPHSKMKGNQLNQRLPVELMRESEKGFDVWTAYMKTWHDLGIDHVQFNVAKSEDMVCAQKKPEDWDHLIVRIAGYSARFTSLTQMAQDSIIGRTVQGL